MGYFSEDALKKFNAMCADGVDFGEEPVYDFARCVKADGDTYGTKGQCKIGKPIGDDVEPAEKDNKVQGRLGKLRNAFERKMGRKMTDNEIAKAEKVMQIGVPIPKGKTAEDVLQDLLPKGEKVIPLKGA
jgi:hypothetical protein